MVGSAAPANRDKACADDDDEDSSCSVESAASNWLDVARPGGGASNEGEVRGCIHSETVDPGKGQAYQTVHRSEPLFQKRHKLIDMGVFIWVTLTHALLTFWPLCGLAIMAGSLHFKPLAYFTAFALGTLLLPRSRHSQGVVDVLDAWIFRHWKRHISLQVVHEAGFDPQQLYVVACFPHGVFPLAAQMHATVWPRLHHRPLSLLTASVNFLCPLWRHYMSVGGCVPASFKNLQYELAQGNCALVHAGGIAEMFECEHDHEVAVVQKRRGFVRAAVQAGVPLLPVYYFGNSQLLSFGPMALRNLSRRLKMSIGFVHGVMGLPILRQHPVTAVVGTPVAVGPALPPGSPDFDKHVEEVHQRFVEALLALYERHRSDYTNGVCTWESRRLVIK